MEDEKVKKFRDWHKERPKAASSHEVPKKSVKGFLRKKNESQVNGKKNKWN